MLGPLFPTKEGLTSDKDIYLFFHVSYYDMARLAHVAGLETHIGAVF